MGLADIYHDYEQSAEHAFIDTITCGPMLQKEYRAIARQDRIAEVYLTSSWRFFVTAEKFMGLAPSNARHDDLIVILMGASVPVIVRPVQGYARTVYELVGPCYLRGYMYGRAIADAARGHKKAAHIYMV